MKITISCKDKDNEEAEKNGQSRTELQCRSPKISRIRYVWQLQFQFRGWEFFSHYSDRSRFNLHLGHLLLREHNGFGLIGLRSSVDPDFSILLCNPDFLAGFNQQVEDNVPREEIWLSCCDFISPILRNNLPSIAHDLDDFILQVHDAPQECCFTCLLVGCAANPYFKNTMNPTTNKAAIAIMMITIQIGRVASFLSSISLPSFA